VLRGAPDFLARVHLHAHRAHGAAQAPRGARGSGADVAASVHGGLLVVQRRPDATADDLAPLTVRRLSMPAGLTPVLVWTGVPADTPALVARVRALTERDPAAHAAARGMIAAAARRMIAALEAGDARETVAAAASAGEAIATLGALSGAPLVPPSLAPLAVLAKAHGGAAKPTGAGGGDQLLALFATAEEAAAFGQAATSAGNTVIDAPVDPAGVRLEATPKSA
jgi:phosphomevalonate kinase